MPLRKSTGQMYPWVSHMHTHIGGECPHQCSYCYVENPRFGRPEKYTGNIRLIEDEFKVNYGAGRTIFVENCHDLFSSAVPDNFILRVLFHCEAFPGNKYVFQSKNPSRYRDFIDIFRKLDCIVGTTIETNREIPISKAPHPSLRYEAMSILPLNKFVTVEPVMDFDPHVLSLWLENIRPEFVNIGADSKGRCLEEPPAWKIKELIERIMKAGIEVREKHNLGRLVC